MVMNVYQKFDNYGEVVRLLLDMVGSGSARYELEFCLPVEILQGPAGASRAAKHWSRAYLMWWWQLRWPLFLLFSSYFFDLLCLGFWFLH